MLPGNKGSAKLESGTSKKVQANQYLPKSNKKPKMLLLHKMLLLFVHKVQPVDKHYDWVAEAPCMQDGLGLK